MEQPPSKETRVPVNLRIKFRSETLEQFVERYAVDVSRGGIFIRTREPLAVGTQLKFDFQLQDTSPLMAGEGTVVWIREHDPTRAGVTPGMGVRFDKLTAASQPVLEKILVDKGRREPSGPNAAGAPATTSGKSGASALPVRRPSSTFSAVDPASLGIPGPTPPLGGPPAGSPGSGPAAPPPGATNPFGASPSSGLAASPLAAGRAGQPPSGTPLKPLAGTPGGTPGAGALPTLESQSALGRLATGPNLSAFGPLGSAPRTKSPVPLLSKQPPGDGSGRITGISGVPAVPTPLEDSERTQIAEGLPEFSNEQPTHVGGPALGLSDIAASRAASITATSRRIPTPPPEPKLSLDDGISPSSAAPLPVAPTTAARTTSPDGMTGGDAAAAPTPGRLSGTQPVVGPHPAPGTLESDLARTVPAAARISAITSAVRTNTPHATPRVVEKKKRPPAKFIVVGVLIGAAAAAGIAFWVLNREPEAAPAPVAANNNAAAPAAAPAAPANTNAAVPETAKTEPSAAMGTPAGEAKGNEAKVGEAQPGEPKPGEAKPGEVKPAEPAAAEAKGGEPKPAEAKPSDTKVAVAEPAPAPKANKRPHVVAHKKGAPAAKGDAEAGGEGADGASDATNVARVISLPTGAEVLIDGQAVGKTPFQGKDIDPGAPHALTVRKEGFETYEHMVSASDWIKGKGPGQSLRVTVKLRKAHAAGEAEGADKKADKPAEPAAEPAKTEAPPAAETP